MRAPRGRCAGGGGGRCWTLRHGTRDEDRSDDATFKVGVAVAADLEPPATHIQKSGIAFRTWLGGKIIHVLLIIGCHHDIRLITLHQYLLKV